jgi:hypothetical protein
MNQTSEMDDDLQPEYDFTQLTVVSRGEGRKKSNLTVQLDPDVATILPDSVAVNESLCLFNETDLTELIAEKSTVCD